MPLPLTVSCFSKIQIGFTFLVPAHLGSPGKGAVKRVCVCVCLSEMIVHLSKSSAHVTEYKISKIKYVSCNVFASINSHEVNTLLPSLCDCCVMHNEALHVCSFTQNYHMPRPLAAFILF